MAAIELSFQAQNKIAVVTRYKPSHTAEAEGYGHTDCILSSGSPVGFFSTAGNFAKGIVFGYSMYAAVRPQYIYAADARAGNCISTILLLTVGKEARENFLNAWLSMRAKTTSYSAYTNNCASHASKALHAAKAIKRSEIPGLDTPGNLHNTIIKDGLVSWESMSGYLEFQPLQCGSDEMLLNFRVFLDPVTKPTKGGPVWA